MMEFIKAGLFCDVEEDDGSAIDKSTGGDWPRERIFDRSMGAAGGHTSRSRWRRILRLGEN